MTQKYIGDLTYAEIEGEIWNTELFQNLKIVRDECEEMKGVWVSTEGV